MALFQSTWASLSTILSKSINNEPFSTRDYQKCFNDIGKYLTSDAYSVKFLAECPIFYAAEKRRTDEEKKVAEEESKRTGRMITPVHVDPNENNEANLPGSELYVEIKAYLQRYVNQLSANEQNLQGESYFRVYGQTWEKFQLVAKILNGLCSNLNANWIRRQRSEGRRYIYDIDILAMNFWNEAFFERSTTVLTEKCLYMIKKDRDGEQVDKSLLKNVIQSYVFVGASIQGNNAGVSANRLRLYQQHFETHFLGATTEYYKSLTSRYQLSGDINSYMEKISIFIQQEEDRVEQYLHNTTRPALLDLIKTHLIAVQLAEIQNAAINWIENDNQSSLKLAYGLLKRIDQANNRVADAFEQRILITGREAIRAVAQRALESPQVFFETILQVYERFSEMLKQTFSEMVGNELKPDRKFLTNLDRALASIVDNNPVTELAQQAKKPAELLARYADLILRKGEKETNGVPVPDRLGQIMIVFNYISEKDAFQTFYVKLLAKRLVTESSASEEHEEFMIRELKNICGNEYTSKIQNMFKDVLTSKNFEEEFRNALTERGDRSFGNFSLMILSGNNWPLAPADPFILPRELTSRIDTYTAFYVQKNNARKLLWFHQHSKCDLWITVNKKKYIFTTSVLQATIFFLFNELPLISIRTLQERTALAQNLLLTLVLGLIQSKIVHCVDIAADRNLSNLQESDLQLDFQIQLSPTYRNDRGRINLIRPIRQIEQRETETTNEEVEIGRRTQTECVIVRVMKARRTISHAELIRETTDQLLTRFRPQIPKIKTCIAGLIEREYLRRDENDREIYHYIA